MKWMKPEFDNTVSLGKGGFTRWHNIRRGGYLTLGGKGGGNYDEPIKSLSYATGKYLTSVLFWQSTRKEAKDSIGNIK